MVNYSIRRNSKIIQSAIQDIFLGMDPPLTVRQIYYTLTVLGVVPKTENGYRQTCYQLKLMRERELIPFGWIADHTRWWIKPDTDVSLSSALERWQAGFRRDFWINQPAHVEIWVEKDALAGVISPVTEEFDVPLFVTRGYSSLTFIYETAENIKALGKPTYIYHFGDYDPSGVDAANKIWLGLMRFGAVVNFERVAITENQIHAFNLPERETKVKDPRSKSWGNKPSVELDALPAPILRDLVKKRIEQHIDPDELNPPG